MVTRHLLFDETLPGLTREYDLTSINGPSVVRMPSGRLHCYFAHHLGDTIRLATADDVLGPWDLHDGGVLHRTDTPATGDFPHVASPDVHVMDDVVRMYFHCPLDDERGAHLPSWGTFPSMNQATLVAESTDGGFTFAVVVDRAIAPSYLRVLRWRGEWWGIAMPGQVVRSADGLDDWAYGPQLFDRDVRHCAVVAAHDHWTVWFTRSGEAPERIHRVTVDPSDWSVGKSVEVLRSAETWEGADLPVEPSERGIALGRKHELRDPFVFENWLLYATAGESGIGAVEVDELSTPG